VGIPLLSLHLHGIHVEGIVHPFITPQEAMGEDIPDRSQSHEPCLAGFGLSQTPEPVAYGIAVRDLVSLHQLEHRAFPPQLPKIFQAPAAGLEQEHQAVHKCRRRITTVAAGTRKMPVSKFPQPYAMVILGEKGQPAMRGQLLLGFFDLETKNGLSYHGPTLLVKGFAWRQSFYIRFYSGQQGFLFVMTILLSRDLGGRNSIFA
jgi:hypothetical protein